MPSRALSSPTLTDMGIRRSLIVLCSLLIACTLSPAMKAKAVVGGTILDYPAPAPPWNVRISVTGQGVCSGSLVAERWVLTASHCVRRDKTGPILPASSFSVFIGGPQIGAWPGFTTTVDRRPASQAFGAPQKRGAINDLALLHLSTSPSERFVPIPLRPSESTVPDGSPVQVVGWGASEDNGQTLFATQIGDYTLRDECYSNGQVCYERSATATSYPAGGDSGAPVVARIRGSYVQVGLFSGPGPTNGVIPSKPYGASALGYLPWIRKITGIPTPPIGYIVRSVPNGGSHLVGADGWMRWIPIDGITEPCLIAKGVPVIEMTHFAAATIPVDHTSNVSC